MKRKAHSPLVTREGFRDVSITTDTPGTRSHSGKGWWEGTESWTVLCESHRILTPEECPVRLVDGSVKRDYRRLRVPVCSLREFVLEVTADKVDEFLE